MKNIVLFLVVLFLTGCEPETYVLPDTEISDIGFWYGLWHGFILPFTFVFSLFNEDVAVYSILNNGAWYDFGFFLGVYCVVSSIIR